MTSKEINRHMIVLKLMLGDLNDVHNNYDIDTSVENTYKQDLIDAINDFNNSQTIWKCKLSPCKKGWCLRYE